MGRCRRTLWLLLAVAVAAADLWSKALWTYPAEAHGAPILHRVVLEDWLYIRAIWNVGGVWSLPIASSLLLWATLLAVPLLLVWMFGPPRAGHWGTAGKALVLGGAAGNLYDRLRLPGVRDFIDVCFGDVQGYHWPTFNVADMALVVGIGLLLALGFLDRPRPAAGAGPTP